MARGQAALPHRLLWTFGLWAQSWGRQQGEAAWPCRTGVERSLLVQEVRAFSAVGNPRLGLGSHKSQGMLALLGSLKTAHSPTPYSYSICSWQETHLDDTKAQPTLLPTFRVPGFLTFLMGDIFEKYYSGHGIRLTLLLTERSTDYASPK